MNYFTNQKPMKSLFKYLNETDLCDKNEGVTSWAHEFMETTKTAIAVCLTCVLNDDSFTDDVTPHPVLKQNTQC